MTIRCILFDIGNTLIWEDGSQTGSMMNWAHLEPVAGAVDALKEIARDFQCYALSNAGDENHDETLEALVQAGYSDCFHGVFTRKSLGLSKDSPSFYRKVCEFLKVPTDNILMVGDHPLQDVLIANEAGLQTCLYNPSGASQYSALLPIQHGEFSIFQQLPDRIISGLYPPCENCLSWLVQYGAVQGILQHVLLVAAVAYTISLRFVQANIAIDTILTHRGALLHDIDKLHPASSRDRHGMLGGEILEGKGLQKIAAIVRRHVPPDEWLPENTPETWEQKIVFYADKLVNHNKLVTLEERMNDLMVRYPTSRDNYTANLPHIRKIENEIMGAIGETPQSFYHWMAAQISGRSLSR